METILEKQIKEFYFLTLNTVSYGKGIMYYETCLNYSNTLLKCTNTLLKFTIATLICIPQLSPLILFVVE